MWAALDPADLLPASSHLCFVTGTVASARGERLFLLQRALGNVDPSARSQIAPTLPGVASTTRCETKEQAVDHLGRVETGLRHVMFGVRDAVAIRRSLTSQAFSEWQRRCPFVDFPGAHT